MLEQSADPDRRRHGVELNPDPFAFEILRRADLARVDRDEAVTKHPRGEHRQRHERAIAGGEAADIFGARHFRSIELELADHAVEQLARIVDIDEIEIDAFGLDLAGTQRDHAVVKTAGEGHRKLGQWKISSSE